jgi:serine/threonine-protein kinase Chk1
MAVKMINKAALVRESAKETERLIRQIQLEIALHRMCNGHINIIGFIGTDETREWRWIAMDYAEGGDLFDKIGKSQQFSMLTVF